MGLISLPTPRQIKGYGWRRQLPDFRDHVVALPPPSLSLPSKANLIPNCPPVYDQGDLGSCTANALASAVDFERLRQGLPLLLPSRLFIYYGERFLEGSVYLDAGAVIRDGMIVLAKTGVCPEVDWPYDVNQFSVKPPDKCYAEALQHLTLKYASVTQTLYTLKYQLGVTGLPVVFGITVYESFESDLATKTGDIPMPQNTERQLGGHAIKLVGYDDAFQHFYFKNSWGTTWPTNPSIAPGYGTLPYAYVKDLNLASDFWELRLEA